MRKFILIIAASAAMLTAAPALNPAAPAAAKPISVETETPTEFSARRRGHWRHGWHRGHRHGWHRGRHYGWYGHGHRHCRTHIVWRFGHPVAVRRCWI